MEDSHFIPNFHLETALIFHCMYNTSGKNICDNNVIVVSIIMMYVKWQFL